MKFFSNFEIINELGKFSELNIKSERGFFRSDLEFVNANAGIIIKTFVEKLPDEWKRSNILIDSRIHMLMKGWYPCIPGWHHDDVPRSTITGQPNYENPEYKSEHILAIIGDCSLTEFLKGEIEVSDPNINQIIYGQWNAELKNKDNLFITKIPEGAMVKFNWNTFHRGVPASKKGWRCFIRATRNSLLKSVNEIRQQSNVYLPLPESGW